MTRGGPPGGYGPPPLPSAKPVGRVQTAPGGTLAPLGRAPLHPITPPDVFLTDEEPTESRSHAATVNRHMRLYLALPLEDRKLVDAFTIRLQKSAAGG